ncbi:RNA polymerase subunit sigma-70, partial [Klebsiella oxytoca]
QRTYQNRVQALPSEQCEDESEQSCLFRKFESLSCTWDTGDVDSRRFGWLSSLEDELLYRRLCKLPEDDP